MRKGLSKNGPLSRYLEPRTHDAASSARRAARIRFQLVHRRSTVDAASVHRH
jgi:hypothetical protein